MRIDPRITSALALVLALGLAGCAQENGADGDAADTLEVAIPEDAGTDLEEGLEEGLEEAGQAVGAGMEAAGEAVGEAGRELQEELGDDDADTVRM